jgi:hypothetical protein
VDEVATEAAHAAERRRQPRLGADAVGGCDQDGVGDVGGQLEQTTEGAQALQDVGRVGRRDVGADALERVGGGVEVDAGGGVRGALGLGAGRGGKVA